MPSAFLRHCTCPAGCAEQNSRLGCRVMFTPTGLGGLTPGLHPSLPSPPTARGVGLLGAAVPLATLWGLPC